MKYTKKDVLVQMHHLSHETGMGLELEDATIRREGRTRFNLHQIDENNHRIRCLNEYTYTAKEMFKALKLARDIYDASTNMDS